VDVQRPEPAAVSVDEVIDVIDEEDEATNTSDIGAPSDPGADDIVRYRPPGTFYKARGKTPTGSEDVLAHQDTSHLAVKMKRRDKR